MNLVIVGASRGLGDAFARGLPDAGDTVYLVSRSEPASLHVQDGVKRTWVKANLNKNSASQTVLSGIKDTVLDVVIYNAGIWESNAFSSKYKPDRVSEDETRAIITVNLTSAITVITALLPKLRASGNGKVILIGSINGLENSAMPELAYNASKFGLRGMAHALREAVRRDRIGVTVINPGSIGWDETTDRDDLIPPADLVALVRCVMAVSNRTVVKEMDVPAMLDTQI
jgi:short-subunit dehydrogenase